jgi:hypothetical protein
MARAACSCTSPSRRRSSAPAPRPRAAGAAAAAAARPRSATGLEAGPAEAPAPVASGPRVARRSRSRPWRAAPWHPHARAAAHEPLKCRHVQPLDLEVVRDDQLLHLGLEPGELVRERVTTARRAEALCCFASDSARVFSSSFWRGVGSWDEQLVCERKEDCLPVLVVHLVRVLFPFGRICATLSAATRRNPNGVVRDATRRASPGAPFASDVGGNSCGEFGGFAPTSVASGS